MFHVKHFDRIEPQPHAVLFNKLKSATLFFRNRPIEIPAKIYCFIFSRAEQFLISPRTKTTENRPAII